MNIRQLGTGEGLLAQSLVKQFEGREVGESHMARLLRNPANVLLVAEDQGQVVGFLLAHQLDSLSQEATALFIYEVDVLPAYHRQGIGTSLINRIRSIAEERGAFEMYVFTNHSNPAAIALYRSTGGQVEEGDELMFVYPLSSR